jgi:hypothetical protein
MIYSTMLKRLRPPLCRSLLFRATGGSISPFAPCSSQVDGNANGNVGIRNISHSAPLFRDVEYEGVSDDEGKVINKFALQPQTSVSLQALMRTGRGEFLHKHFEDISKIDQHSATELVLIQVCTVSYAHTQSEMNAEASKQAKEEPFISFHFALLFSLYVGRKFSAS